MSKCYVIGSHSMNKHWSTLTLLSEPAALAPSRQETFA